MTCHQWNPVDAMPCGSCGSAEVAAVSALLQEVKESYTKKLKVSRKLFDKIDQDKSGSINQHEFLRYVLLREGKAGSYLAFSCYHFHHNRFTVLFTLTILL